MGAPNIGGLDKYPFILLKVAWHDSFHSNGAHIL